MPFEHSKKRIAVELAILAGAAAVLVLIAWAALSGLMELGVRHVPPKVERSLGNALAPLVRRGQRPCASPEVAAAVDAMARRLAKEAGLDDAQLSVAVLDDEAVNAFAFPGGHVFVLSGLLQKSETPDEVAGVLAHELGHVALRHHLRGAIRQLGVSAALTAVLGDIDALTALLIGGSSQLLDLAFSREQEEEADAFAVEVAAKAGFDPAAVGRLLERMEQFAGLPSILRTHPSGPDRRQRLEKLAAEHPVSRSAPAASVSMEALKGRCAPGGDQ